MFDVVAITAWIVCGLVVEVRSWRLTGRPVLAQLAPAAALGPLWLLRDSGRRASSGQPQPEDLRLQEGTGATVVVGLDNQVRSIEAARWAAERASQMGAPLRLVHAFSTTAPATDSAGGYARVFESASNSAHQSVDKVAARLGQIYPALEIETVVAAGPAASVLTRHCSDAALLVLGTRQRPKVSQILGGSVTNRLTGRVRCPVVSLPFAPSV
jgi:nucleotide-binding universal stress UspA family protein